MKMTLNCLGNLVDLKVPKVMGILNSTPNSFYDGGRYLSDKALLSQVEKMLFEGATFIDVGAYSSKPNAELVSEKEEVTRIVPVVELILKHFPKTILSIDTFRSSVAKICVDNGAAMINDISAGSLDEKMFEMVSNLQVPYCMMHMRGTPQSMQNQTNYTDITKELLLYFSEKVAKARSFGINDLVIDPGFGFAKNTEQNYEVLQKLNVLEFIELPLLVGFSRKSMVYKPLDITPEEALNGTTVVNTIALTKGAKILRVHDVKEAVQCITLFEKCNSTAEKHYDCLNHLSLKQKLLMMIRFVF
jgi:dihydropteroate synthase